MDADIYTKLTALIDLSRIKLANFLKSIPGTKDITLDPRLIRPLERICGAKWLRLNDIEKIYKFEESTPNHSNTTHIYFIPSILPVFLKVVEQIQALRCKNSTINYHILSIPKSLVSFDCHLEQIGLYDIVKLHSYSWELIEIDRGILSLELSNFFGEIFCNNDYTLLPALGKSLCSLFCISGQPRITVSIGKLAPKVLQHLEIYTEYLNEPPKENYDFETFIILDRSVDYVSSLLTTSTYTGLLSEIFNVNSGVVEDRNIDTSASTSSESPKTTALFNLDTQTDNIYKDIKDRHISEVSDILSNRARQLKSEAGMSREMDLNEMKAFVQSKLQNVSNKSRVLSGHLQACEKIIEKLGNKIEKILDTEHSFIENTNKKVNIENIEYFILREEEYRSLRLLCLMTLTQKLSYEDYHDLRLQYLHQFGYHLLYIFDNLISAGLIQEPVQTKLSNLSISLPGVAKSNFYTISKKLKLFPDKPEDVNVRAPTCPSYVFGGRYIPLVAQLVTVMVKTESEKDLKMKLDLFENSNITSRGAVKSFPLQKRTFLVCVIGGLTYAEIAALNLVEKLCNCKIIVCSNAMISGNDLMEASKI